jgi:glycosyltransferase involved in cell wall biosynthesis
MGRPDISVVIPARNEGGRLAPTIRSIARARTTDARLEFIIADDASTDDTTASLLKAVPELLNEKWIDIRVLRLEKQAGIYRARNQAAAEASAEILFGTDAHVRFSRGWDEVVLRRIAPDRILAGVTTQKKSGFKGYGCDLVVPFMGTQWRCDPASPSQVQVAPCHATVIPRKLFQSLGGYDAGMRLYGAGEPEFSVRAWLHGAEVVICEELQVEHHFKPKSELMKFWSQVRPFWIHNCLRFGVLYLSEAGCLQMMRYHAQKFPEFFPAAMRQLAQSDVLQRRQRLEQTQQRSFDWFVTYFGLRNELGGEIL